MTTRLYVFGYPSQYGGADTELWHTIRLWRRFGVEVTMVPTWHANAEQERRLSALGVRTQHVRGPEQLKSLPGLPGALVISFCNGEFLKLLDILTQIRCRIIWVNCMTWVFPTEVAHYEKHGPLAAYVFQSNFQREQLAPVYQTHGARTEQFHLIRGAFCCDEFPFAPRTHRRSEPFVIGRIARDDLDKWSSNLWPIYARVSYGEKLARVMAWSERLSEKCGAPPDWAEALPANAESAQQFLSTLHCLFAINGGARENWPRAGLEAMSSGVPIVAQRQWGWCEMIEHGVTGLLGDDDCELAHYAAMLAHDEELRLRIAIEARHRLESVLASPELLWNGWRALFTSLDGSC